MTDEEFREFVLRNREFGFGRMMHVISDLWRERSSDGSALSVGATYFILERRRRRCALEGHDRTSGTNWDWCDRCGAQLDPDDAHG